MKIIVLQLARLGDILQTFPALQGLKSKYPDSEITYVARSTFADAVRLSPHVDKIVEFQSKEILGPALSGDKTESANKLAGWIPKETYDLLINFTFSPASAYLASLIRARARRGIHCMSDGSYMITDSWSQYVFAQVLNHNINILHLNDLFARIAGVEKDIWPVRLSEATSPEPVLALQPEQIRIGIQLTASTPEKTLNALTWIEVCKALLLRNPNAQLVFFGAKADLQHIEAVLNGIGPDARERSVILAGKMRFHENLKWLRSCQCLVAPDTAIVHLASLAGTRIIQIPVGPVRPEETGPYGDGHHVVYPVSCTPIQLGAEIARIAYKEPAPKGRPVVAEAATRLTRCSNDTLRSEIIPKNFTPDESTNFFQKCYYLLAEFRHGGREENIEIPALGDPAQSEALDLLVKTFDVLCTVRRLAEFGQHYCVKMLQSSGAKAELQGLMEKLAEIEAMLANVQKTVPLVKPLIDTWSVSKDVAYVPTQDATGRVTVTPSVDKVIAITEGSYRELGQNVEIIQQLLQTAVDAAQKSAAKNAPKKSAPKNARKPREKRKEQEL